MNIAVFADVHGRILLAFKLAARYQRETGERIDLILQCGDMGIFPDPAKLDRATLRHAEHDETELGFSRHFVEPNDATDQVLSAIECDLVCVRGNHEDHEFLDNLEQTATGPAFPVDCYERIRVLKTGWPLEFAVDDQRIRVLGIGRVGAPAGETDTLKAKYIQPYELDKLRELERTRFDVLVTHDARRDFVRSGIGMHEIGHVLGDCRPAYHFFGHTGQPFSRRTDRNGMTVCSKLADFEWDESVGGRPLKPGSFGLLRWQGPDHHTFETVSEPWLAEYTFHSWEYVG